MTRISFIGGGSVLWMPELIGDIALTPNLAGAEIVLHDIDLAALQRMLPVCRRIARQLEADMTVWATLDRAEALRGADFVILCVGIGGLPAMRHDLEIPEKFGIYQSVGDTVGPGGLARALRHIPFAVQVAQEMERTCPGAWLLNLTNPMSTICRAVRKATSVPVVGLCHEVAGVRRHLAGLFAVKPEDVLLEIGGINHLPVITRCTIAGQDGFAMLRTWLQEHAVDELVHTGELGSVYEVFNDALAVKLSLFQESGVMYGAGDRHVAEFFPHFLKAENDWGEHFGVRLTTVDQREEMFRLRCEGLPGYIPPQALSGEQMAPLIAALLGDQPGQFVVNIPNQGQIDNLPRQAIVECIAHVDRAGLHPLAVGELPDAAHRVVSGHIERQELIVAAALSGDDALALEALTGDPLVSSGVDARSLLHELLSATRESYRQMEAVIAANDHPSLRAEVSALNAQLAPQPLKSGSEPVSGFSVGHSTIQELIDHPAARAILEVHFPGMLDNPQLSMALGMTLAQIAPFAPLVLTEEKLASVEEALKALNPG